MKDKGDLAEIKEVNAYDTSANRWREFANWSPANTTDLPLYLQADGKLSFGDGTHGKHPPSGAPGSGGGGAAGNRGSAYDQYVSDPFHPVPYTQRITLNYPRDFMTEDQRFAAGRPDVLVYETEPLAADLTVAGNIEPELVVSSSGTDSDFIVKLIDVFPDDYQYPETGKTLPDGSKERVKPLPTSPACVFEPGGYQMLLRGEPFPGFRNSFEEPTPLKPNTPAKISFVMPGIVHTFKKGHRVMVQIQSTWFPLVARNPQRFVPNYKLGNDADFQKATERVYHSPQFASRLMLRVLK